VLEDMLSDLGCAVVDLVASIDVEDIDVTLLDVNFNGMSPRRDALVARSVPFVFSTGYHKERLLDGYRIFPALQKPYHVAELADILAKLLTPKEPVVESTIAAVGGKPL
jgi:hypothetical protein